MSIEQRAKEFHNIYRDEIMRQVNCGERDTIRHMQEYEDLAENVKELDRALARHVEQEILRVRIEELERLFKVGFNTLRARNRISQLKSQLEEVKNV